MDPNNPETELLAERIDEQQVVIEAIRDKLVIERTLADRLAAALYSRGFTGNQIDALAQYEQVRHA